MESLSQVSSTPSPLWKIQYAVALEEGISLEDLLEQLEEELRLKECELVYENEEIDQMDLLERTAKTQMQYQERLEYLNTLLRMRKNIYQSGKGK